MGFVFTIVYIALAYLSPAFWFPQLGQYRVQLWMAILAIVSSVPALPKSRLLRHPETFLIGGLIIAACASQIANGWLGGAILAFENIVPHLVVFYLLAVNCRTIRRFKIVVLVLAVVSVISVMAGARAVASGESQSAFVLFQMNEAGQSLSRIRGLGFVNDPNDLAQLLVMTIALLGVIIRRKHRLTNLLVVWVPIAVLAYGIYLTHSRGAVIGLAVVAFFSFRGRFSPAVSATIAVALAAGLMAFGFSGGRSISADAGADRMAAWGAGLQFFKTHPFFGIGYGRFADNYEITAHNSFVLCLAELGLFGYLFWITVLTNTFFNLDWLSKADNQSKPVAIDDGDAHEHSELMDPSPNSRGASSSEVARFARILRTAMIGFLVTAWFLSRAYTMGLFLLVGLTAALYCISAIDQPPQPVRASRLARASTACIIGSIAIIYTALRLRVFM